MHRARSATRSKPVTQALRGSGRSTWQVDESATGSVNLWTDTTPEPRPAWTGGAWASGRISALPMSATDMSAPAASSSNAGLSRVQASPSPIRASSDQERVQVMWSGYTVPGPAPRRHGMGGPMAQPAHYFPVSPKPLRMQAGLMRFPVDFGNGVADTLFFQLDEQAPRYVAAREALLAPGGSPSGPRHALLERNEAEAAAHAAVLDWIDRTLDLEHPDRPRPTGTMLSPYDARLRMLQEDAVVLHRDAEGRDAAIMIHVPGNPIGMSSSDPNRTTPSSTTNNAESDMAVR